MGHGESPEATQRIPVTNAVMAAEGKTPETKGTETTAPEVKEEPLISIDEFFKVQLKVGQILSAEKVEKSEKLLKLSVDLGESKGPRQIVSGIAKHYAPEVLPGRKIVVVANLKPAKLMGQMSEGMLLAACDDAGNLELVSPGVAMPIGTTVR